VIFFTFYFDYILTKNDCQCFLCEQFLKFKLQILKKIAEDSIEKSSPFPKFPKELAKFNTLTFNLSIQFKTN